MAEVPTVTGMTESEAFKALEAAGFSPQALPSEFNKEVASGNVFKQTPAGGTEAPKGSVVSYVVSRGTELVQVPDVTGKSQSSATSTLQKAGFKVSVKESTSDKVEQGRRHVPEPAERGVGRQGLDGQHHRRERTGDGRRFLRSSVMTRPRPSRSSRQPASRSPSSPRPGRARSTSPSRTPNAGERADYGSTVTITLDGPPPTP